MEHPKKDHKPAPKPRKPKVDIEALVAEGVAKELAKIKEQEKGLLGMHETHVLGTIGPVIPPTFNTTEPTIVETAPSTPTPEHHTQIEDAEKKAIGIWGKIKAWKYRWLVVGAIALILVVLGYQWVNGIQNKRSEAKIEKKKDDVKAIEVKEDTTLLQLRVIEKDKIRILDSLNDAYAEAIKAMKIREDYEKKKYR